jgi:hypothetical protein
MISICTTTCILSNVRLNNHILFKVNLNLNNSHIFVRNLEVKSMPIDQLPKLLLKFVHLLFCMVVVH